MAQHATHRAQIKSLHKKGLITDKQHERAMAKLDAMVPVELPASGEGDPAMSAAVTPALAASVPATASVPGGPQNGSAAPAVQPPAA